MTLDSDNRYWHGYTNLQHVKHALIKEYLGGWFPKLGSWSGRIIYFDTHAGRGRHEEGQAGSPLIALTTFLGHSYRDQILRVSEARFVFVERAADNVGALRAEIDAVRPLPERVFVSVTSGNAFEHLGELLGNLESGRSRMAPAFVFVDPYGFKLPADILRRLLAAGRVELFVNVIWRELDMAMAQAHSQESGGMVETLNSVFDGDEWRTRIARDASLDQRADQAVDLFREKYGARWATTVRMLASNEQTRYMLVHFTNHEAGRDLMKDAIWKVCGDGGFQARRSDNPNQTMLIVPKPDLAPLEDWALSALAYGPLRWSELTARVRVELWRNTHLNDVIRGLRQSGRIVALDFEGRFSEKADPLLSLPQRGSDAAGSPES